MRAAGNRERAFSPFMRRDGDVDIVIALAIVLILSPLLFALLISADVSILTKLVIGAAGMFFLTCLPFLALLLGGYRK